MHFQLISATGLKFDDEVYEVLVPTKAGVIALFEGHMPLISAGAPGVLNVRKKQSDRDDAMEQFAVNGGIIQVDGKAVRFVADDVTTSEEVSEKEAEEALARAEELVKNAQSHIELQEAKKVLEHSSARLHVARVKRRHHN
jgi:F-type H+-transporting ATPase subunit epsilon